MGVRHRKDDGQVPSLECRLVHAALEHEWASCRRRTTMPLIEIARAETEEEAMEGLERWKQGYPDVWPLLDPEDLPIDAMQGRVAPGPGSGST